jgi:tartrate dehydratase beta subunit/fumarate hydratase class I family protein
VQALKPATAAASPALKAKKPSLLKAVATSLTRRANPTSTARMRIAKPFMQATEGRIGLVVIGHRTEAEVDGIAEAAAAAAGEIAAVAAEAVAAVVIAEVARTSN